MSGTVRMVLSGACGIYTGTVVEWQLDQIKATSSCSCSDSLYDVTAQQFTDGLLATWPSDLHALRATDFVLALLFQGRLLPAFSRMGDSFPPGTLDVEVPKKGARSNAVASTSPVIHLVFRNIPRGGIAQAPVVAPPPAKTNAQSQGSHPPPRTESGSCCLVA